MVPSSLQRATLFPSTSTPITSPSGTFATVDAWQNLMFAMPAPLIAARRGCRDHRLFDLDCNMSAAPVLFPAPSLGREWRIKMATFFAGSYGVVTVEGIRHRRAL